MIIVLRTFLAILSLPLLFLGGAGLLVQVAKGETPTGSLILLVPGLVMFLVAIWPRGTREVRYYPRPRRRPAPRGRSYTARAR